MSQAIVIDFLGEKKTLVESDRMTFVCFTKMLTASMTLNVSIRKRTNVY